MSSALKPALPQGAGGQPAQQNNGSKAALGGQPLNHASPPHPHPGRIHSSPTLITGLGHLNQNAGHPGLPSHPGHPGPAKPARTSPLGPSPDKASSARPLALARTPDRKDDVPAASHPHSNGTGDSPGAAVPDSAESGTPPVAAQPSGPSEPPVAAQDEVAASEPRSGAARLSEDPAVAAEGAPSAGDLAPCGSTGEASLPPERPERSEEPAISVKPEIDVAARPAEESVPELVEKSVSPAKNLDNIIEQLKHPVDSASQSVPPAPAVAEDPPSEASVADESSSLAIESRANGEKEAESESAKTGSPVDAKTEENITSVEASAVDSSTPSGEAARPVEVESETLPVESSPGKVPPSPATPMRKKTEVKPKSTLKLATVTPTLSRKRKKEIKSSPKPSDGPSPPKRMSNPREKHTPSVDNDDASPASADGSSTPDGRASKRNRTKVQPYQSPTPELAILTKLSVNQGRTTPTKQTDDKLIVFYKNEFLAVRNAEGGFYVCQTMQNVYRASRKIKIRWLSQDKAADPAGEIYKPDFYDVTDMECVLTTLSLQRAGSAGLRLGATELARTHSILGRALAQERGEPAPPSSVTEEHPDGLDLSLYKDESQLDKKKRGSGGTPSRKRHLSESTPAAPAASAAPAPSPPKRAARTPLKPTPPRGRARTSAPPPISAPTTNKTATTPGKAVPGPKATPKKAAVKTPAKATPSTSKARGSKTPKTTPAKAAAAAKAAQLASTPSTSTGKATRTPRKPPALKK